MADVDEDAIPRNGPEAGDIDLSDETQDFRFLSIVSRDDAKIPKRGDKDFEPHATALQSATLAASRAAMHDALSFNRVHAGKKHILAHYDPATNMAYTDHARSTLFRSIGRVKSIKDQDYSYHADHINRLWLLPEEALYLLERGTIDIRWPPMSSVAEDLGLPMSLQAAYSTFIGASQDHGDALTFERYSVYAALKRLGYAVHRASTWNAPPGPPTSEAFPPPGPGQRLGLGSDRWRTWLMSMWQNPTFSNASEHLVQPRCYRRYADIYKSLALIPWYDPTTQSAMLPAQLQDPDHPLRVAYNIYKPSNVRYRKSAPGPADFHVVVLDARSSQMPSLEQLDALLRTLPYEPPRDNAQLYQKVRNGHKSVILAVVDQGVTNYLRWADAAFGRQRLYDRSGAPNKGKRSGNHQTRKTAKR